MPKPIELLLPAGDFEKMKFAIAYGADAVYLGVPQFSLRARENGFKKRDSVAEAVHYAHERGKKVYITANILAHNHKVDSFVKYVTDFLKQCQPDAWIMSDPGLIMLMQEHFPKEVIHLSVQANTVNFATAQFWQKLGIKRIILSRELSINEIAAIRQHCPDLELETFVHGAICIAHSGRCLISNYMAYRDPNQGTCANSCRWEYKMYEKSDVQPKSWHEQPQKDEVVATPHDDPYVHLKGDYYLEESQRPGELMPIDEDENGTYLMNARDLCAIEYLKELSDAGVDSFKVEGRSKSVYYVALIARVYRKAIDNMIAGKKFDPELFKEVFATSNRGLISGFLKGNPGHTAQEYEESRSSYSNYRFSGILRGFDDERKLINIEPRNPLRKGQKLEMVLPNETKEFEVDKILNTRFEEIPEIHGGLTNCWIPYPQNPGEFMLLRERI